MTVRSHIPALDLTGREAVAYNRVECTTGAMRQHLALSMVILMLTSTMSFGIAGAEYQEAMPTIPESTPEGPESPISPSLKVNPNPWIEPSLWQRVEYGQEQVRVTVITHSLRELGHWQYQHEQVEKQLLAGAGEQLVATDPSDGVIDHRTFWMDASLFHKLPGVPGIIGILDAQSTPEPYDITPLDSPDATPTSVRSGEIHGAVDAWERGYAGDGIVVAVADTGVDFAHPDLDGTQARILDGKNHHGWPMMFDHNSMYYWLVNGESYPSRNTWYADTSTLDWDNDSNGILDASGYNISDLPASISGIYHLGEHPDSTLRNQMGGDVPLLVIDSVRSGEYDLVIPDVNRNGNFSDDERMSKGNETAGLDEDGDGIRDVSAGLLYWVSDGINGVPYAETYAARHGYSNRIAGAGNLTLFMLDSGSHGTLCASAVAAQAQVNNGAVLGMAPNATVASIGNHYSGGHSLDGWRWIAEGNDGNPETWDDQPHIGSFSFGYSSIDDSGADSYSLYLDWLTRVYNNQTHYAVAIGNGGHGYGTVAVPGASQGIFSVGAFSSRTNQLWGQSAPWNNRGPNIVGRMDPDIVAVGWSATGDIPLNLRNNGNSATTTWGGTSLATPITAGLLAVVEQAWFETNGDYPMSQPFRDFVLATADDRGYDPFVQGGGWFNASRATATIDGDNGTWSVTPSQWMTGTFQGEHRDANINVIHRGESQTVPLELTNHGNSSLDFVIFPVKHEALAHEVGQWNSIGDGSEGGDNNTWDGYQGDRPDLLIPIHVNNTTYQLPLQTNLVRARAVIEYAAFDGNLDRSSNERIELTLYRWSDDDGDGIWVGDEDNDSMVDEEDWTESSEFDAYGTWYHHGPQAEFRVGLPFDDMEDGLFLGVSRRDVSSSGLDNVSIEWDWTAFGPVTDDWISPRSTGEGAPPFWTVSPNSTTTYNFTVDVPLDAEPGLYQHGLVIRSFAHNMWSSPLHEWTLPIVTNVPYIAPVDITAKPLDGNVSNQTLYSESWISGAQRWSWRAESGDWRIMSIDWPEDLATGGTAILDVDWDDNPYTDVDVLWLSQTAHGYAEEDSQAYGDSTFWIEERSTNNHRGSGSHDWGTFTGESREVFVVPTSPGLHQLALHTAHHGVTTNDNALNISVGYVAAEQSGFHKVVTDWSEGSGEETIHVVSTVPMPLESIRSFGWTQPIYFENETAYQDTSNDKMSASWWHNFSVADAAELSIRMDAFEEADLDLYLFRDSDEDGEFESNEEVTRSWSSTSAESIDILSPSDGNYSVAVHGWSVSDSVQFWLEVEVIAGTMLNVTNATMLNASEIAAQWPSGSTTLAGAVPEGALELVVDYEMPDSEGVWQGFVEVTLEGGIDMRMPFTYELIDLDPEIEFVTPENLTETNLILPLALHAQDIGSGFALDDFSWSGLNNDTSVPNATSVEATLWNLSTLNITNLWNSGNHSSNLTFREVWVNSTLPAAEQWHEYQANIADLSGRSAADWLSVKFDTTAPTMIISHIPQITNESELLISVQTESDAVFRHSGDIVAINGTGFVEYIVYLEESEIEFIGADSIDEPSHIYYATGNNSFSLSVTDPSGNLHENSWQVVLDSTLPDIQKVNVISTQPEYEYLNQSWTEVPLNLTAFITEVILSPDVKSTCISIEGDQIETIEQCREYSVFPYVFNSEEIGQPSPVTHIEDPFWDLTEVPDDSYRIVLEVVDWAGNSHSEEYSLSLDRTLPDVEWDISPSADGLLSDHRLGLSWTASENVDLVFTHNGVQVEVWDATYGGLFFELNQTGDHEFCIDAWDVTRGQHNENRFHECQTLTLEPSLYVSQVWAIWDGTVVGTESVQLVFSRGPNQWANVTHVPEGADASDLGDIEPTYSFEPGASFVEVELALDEGDNEFYLVIEALDHVQSYWLYVESDTISPRLNLTQVANRTTNLEPVRVISGVCETRASVTIWTEVSSTSFVCGDSGNFTVQLGVPANASWHVVSATTIDLGGNTNETSIEVLYQDWFDWAIDDAEAGGPILYWGLGILISALAMLGLTMRMVNRRSARRLESEESIEEVSDWLDEMLEESDPEVSEMPAEPLPEEDELRAWARGERDVSDWRDRVPEDEPIDLD